MKKILLAMLVLIIAIVAVKFVMGEDNMTMQEFVEAILENVNDSKELSNLVRNLGDGEIENFMTKEAFISSLKTLLGSAAILKNDDLDKNISLFIKKLFDLNQNKAIEIVNELNKVETIKNYLEKIMQESEDDSIDFFARACKAISGEE